MSRVKTACHNVQMHIGYVWICHNKRI